MMDRPLRILLASDAWMPQTNGVVTTLTQTVRNLRARGHEVRTIVPTGFPGVACPFYSEIRLCVPQVKDTLEDFAPDHVHIATEGPVGLATRSACLMYSIPFTTSYHTDFPSYMQHYLSVPKQLTYEYLRWFHGKASRTMVATGMVQAELEGHGFGRMVRWSRGVDTDLFRPAAGGLKNERPVLVCVGRVAREKNLEVFLDLKLPFACEKRVIGEGPMLAEYRAKYEAAGVKFTGLLKGEALVEQIAAADCMVFPSKTDTFGLVILEALACGVPVAAYRQPGPLEILSDPQVGCADDDLTEAVERTLRFRNRETCRAHAEKYSWGRCTEQFLGNLVPTRSTSRIPERIRERERATLSCGI